MSKTVPIRRSLLGNLIVIVLVLGGSIVALSYVSGDRALRRFSQSLLRQTMERTEAQLHSFFDPVTQQLFMLQQWSESGLLDPAAPETVDRLVQAAMRRYPWITSTMVASEDGTEHMLLRSGEQWSRRRFDAASGGDNARWWRWQGQSEESEALASQERLDYDPRQRPWFQGAVARRESGQGSGRFWTDPYTFFTTQEPGITASLAFVQDDQIRVLGLDVLLTDVSGFTSQIEVLESGMAFVLSEDGRLVGLPRGDPADGTETPIEYLLQMPRDVDTPMAQDLSRALLGSSEQWARAIRFTSEGEAWWGQVEPFELGGGRRLLIGVGVPEVELLGDLQRQRIGIGLITLVLLGVASVRAVALARRYATPIEALVRQSDRISKGDLSLGEPIRSSVREVHRLADAQDQMRQALETLLKIEHDLKLARSIQQNTFPTILPTLPGFDLDAWSEPADETGGDSYDVIGLRRRTGERAASLADQFLISDGDAGRAVLMLADATGHGIGPALSVTQVRAMLRAVVRMTDDLVAIGNLINEQLQQDLPLGRFVTVWLGSVDAADHTLTSFSGGQAPLLHYRSAADEFDVLNSDTIPLGLMAPMALVEPVRLWLEPGDMFVVLSDGIFEASDASGEEFGVDRTLEVIRRHRDASSSEILKRVRVAVEQFTAGAPADDDRTGLCIRRV